MTAERPGGETPPSEEGLTASNPPSPANAGTPAVTLCPGFYIVKSRYVGEHAYAECDVCGVTGPAGCRCEQTVIA
jgi:hypothetical protein